MYDWNLKSTRNLRASVNLPCGEMISIRTVDETVVFSWFGQEETHAVPIDSSDYRYDHGGGEYQQACEACWKEANRA